MFFNNVPYGQACQPSSKPLPSISPQCEGYFDPKNEIPLQNQVVMPQPSGLPWNIQQMSWGTPSPPTLVEFTAPTVPEIKQPEEIQNTKIMFPFKRKSELEPPIPTKQLRTDEAMAAHLNCLHISSDFTSHTKSAGNMSDDDIGIMSIVDDELMDRLKSERQMFSFEDRLKNAERIVLCEEMRRLKNEPILPPSLINRLEKPCMSLVLWKPPKNLSSSGNNQSDPNNNPDNNRPNCSKRSVLVPDSNAMDVEL